MKQPRILAAMVLATFLLSAIPLAATRTARADPGPILIDMATFPPSGGAGPTRGGDVLLSMPRANQVDPAVAHNSHDRESWACGPMTATRPPPA